MSASHGNDIDVTGINIQISLCSSSGTYFEIMKQIRQVEELL